MIVSKRFGLVRGRWDERLRTSGEEARPTHNLQGRNYMTRESQEYPDCVEVPVSAKIMLMGEWVATVEGLAVSQPMRPQLQTVLLTAVDRQEVDRLPLHAIVTEDTEKTLIAKALFAEAAKPEMAQQFAEWINVLQSDRRYARALQAQELRAGA